MEVFLLQRGDGSTAARSNTNTSNDTSNNMTIDGLTMRKAIGKWFSLTQPQSESTQLLDSCYPEFACDMKCPILVDPYWKDVGKSPEAAETLQLLYQ